MFWLAMAIQNPMGPVRLTNILSNIKSYRSHRCIFSLIFKLITKNSSLVACYRTSGITPTSVQVMTWCRQATSYCISQCWSGSSLPNGVNMAQLGKEERVICSYRDDLHFNEIWNKILKTIFWICTWKCRLENEILFMPRCVEIIWWLIYSGRSICVPHGSIGWTISVQSALD